jgi:hypothetical protein
VVGVDEFFWTEHCFVDGYFETEPMKSTYLRERDGTGYHPPYGEGRGLEHPFWNPRECVLAVYAQRLRQVTDEWRNLVRAYNKSLKAYVRTSLFKSDSQANLSKKAKMGCFDNEELDGTQELDNIVDLLSDFKTCITGTIDSWKQFEAGPLKCYEASPRDLFSDSWRDYERKIQICIAELSRYRSILEEKYTCFKQIHQRVSPHA